MLRITFYGLRFLALRIRSSHKNLSVHPDTTYVGIEMPTAQLIALRVQRLDTLEWFNWDNGVWDRTPKITLGQNLYVAAYCVNVGSEGVVTMRFRRADNNVILMSNSLIVPTGETMGLEMTDYTISNVQDIIAQTEPGNSVTFTVAEDIPTCPTGQHYDPVSKTCVQDTMESAGIWILMGVAGALFVASWLVINKWN